MRPLEVIPGEVYNDLTVVREVGKTMNKRCFLCRCECGSEVEVRLDHLRSGHTSSCGRCGIEHGGQRKTLREWAESQGIKPTTLRARLKVMKMGEALSRK